jgi:hypothetical protein
VQVYQAACAIRSGSGLEKTEEAFLQLAGGHGVGLVQAQQLVGSQHQAGLGRPSHQQLQSPVDRVIVRSPTL